MKKFLILLSLLSLAGCRAQQEKKVEKTTPSSSQSSTASTTASSSSEQQKPETDYAAFQQVIDRYQASLGKDGTMINQDEVNIFLTHLQSYPGLYTGPYYVQTDFDQDGTDELAIALGCNSSYVLLDLYTLSQEGDLLRLSDQFRSRGPGIGERITLWPLEDGSYSLESSGHVSNYRFDPAAKNLVLVGEDLRPAEAVNLAGLSWQEIGQAAASTASANSSSASTDSLDVDGLLAGDFSSIAGTWKNAEGRVMVIDQAGDITYPDYPDSKAYFKEVRLLDGQQHLSTAITNPEVMASGTVPYIILPVGVEVPSGLRSEEPDLTIQSKVRIYGFQGPNYASSVAERVYYKQ